MQVEYEDAHAHGSVSFSEPSANAAHHDHEGSEPEEHEPEQEPGQEPEDEERGPAKKKRVTKSRQSLAEKSKGTTIFPLARVKRIIKADKELDMMSSEATFLVAVATEYFIKHFMEEGYTKARLERRRIVNYKDMANVVARSDEFEFLRDVIPLPITLTEALERRKAKIAADEESPNEDEDEEDEDEEDDDDEEEEQDDAPAKPKVRRPSVKAPLVEDAENLPPLALSTNPLFPNAIVKRPPNTHARGPVAQPAKGAAGAGAGAGATAAAATPATPRTLTGKNAPSTPHSLTTRGSARRSLNADTTPTAPPAELAEEDAMEVDE